MENRKKPMILKRRDKYKMYQAMVQYEDLTPHLPVTKQWKGKEAFYQMLSDHRGLVIKPNRGLKGKNIFFVSKWNSTYYVQMKDRSRTFKSMFSAYSYLNRRIKDTKYIMQERIFTARVKGKPFDIRVIVQFNPKKKKWEVTGYKFRVAGKGMLITNANAGGNVVNYKEAMKFSSLPPSKQKGLLKKAKEVSLRSAEIMGECYEGHRMFGTDIGVSKDGEVVIFEINRRPLIRGFSKKHRNKIRQLQKM
ncbi:YheC/YheD family protein [Alteribacter aurantiacus]|uniref:YheC/YheD family protein n=1 Tax=Alteribacter aurantiacus TaxID=254410 RepID=UPI00042602D0|nr:YheC/YheD family protein [Alteribacter aurantiacus]